MGCWHQLNASNYFLTDLSVIWCLVWPRKAFSEEVNFFCCTVTSLSFFIMVWWHYQNCFEFGIIQKWSFAFSWHDHLIKYRHCSFGLPHEMLQIVAVLNYFCASNLLQMYWTSDLRMNATSHFTAYFKYATARHPSMIETFLASKDCYFYFPDLIHFPNSYMMASTFNNFTGSQVLTSSLEVSQSSYLVQIFT